MTALLQRNIVGRPELFRSLRVMFLVFATLLLLGLQSCAVLAGGAAGAATGYVAGHEASEHH